MKLFGKKLSYEEEKAKLGAEYDELVVRRGRESEIAKLKSNIKTLKGQSPLRQDLGRVGAGMKVLGSGFANYAKNFEENSKRKKKSGSKDFVDNILG